MPRFTVEELKNKHLVSRITARDSASEFPAELYEDGGVLVCKVCQHSIDYIRCQTEVEASEASGPGKHLDALASDRYIN